MSEKSNEDVWENYQFSDPETADPNNFVFIVHTMSSFLDNKQTSTEFLARIDNGKILACSVIGKNEEQDINVTLTYCPVGVILKVPAQNIIHTSVKDLGWEENARIQKDYTENNIRRITLTPDDLLRGTSSGVHNEVVVQSKSRDAEIEIIGVFLNPHENGGKIMDENLFNACRKKAEELASDFQVPLFQLPEQDSQNSLDAVKAIRPDIVAKAQCFLSLDNG